MHRSIRAAVVCLASFALAACGAATTCLTGETACGGVCVDLQSDASHCGACGVSCGLGTCSAGACVCDPGATECSGTTRCVNLRSDAANCGGCGKTCSEQEICSNGVCACSPGATRACSNNTVCQTPHPNGLGQTYYDCLPLDSLTVDEARLAAAAWAPDGQPFESGLQCGNCLCRTNGTALTATKAAIWCYGGSNAPGHVKVTDAANCFTAACPSPGDAAWR
ncbi:hypothetical protein [Anaeromyxobacter oryzisoli]|uniref:hypothetical protein n=1 Tax=Anaeromyxobacter oryzisoli TaxID=2925408 RepID=UPI001F5A522E|nr:hypothetical protein [Anaeromyxobacter sp. SG63]